MQTDTLAGTGRKRPARNSQQGVLNQLSRTALRIKAALTYQDKIARGGSSVRVAGLEANRALKCCRIWPSGVEPGLPLSKNRPVPAFAHDNKALRPIGNSRSQYCGVIDVVMARGEDRVCGIRIFNRPNF